MSTSENKYIEKRKWQAKRLSALFFLMRIFPVNRRKIVFAAFEGDGGFGCNPKYIAEELHRRHSNCKMIWLTHEPKDPKREFPEYIKAVKDTSFRIAFHLATAKVWVDNYRKPYGTLKRKGQMYIQTWHATIGFKAVGLYRGDAFPKIARFVSEWDSNLADYVLSNSRYCDEVYPKKLLYSGPTLRVGSPRTDPLINDREVLSKRLRDRLGLKDKSRLLLYAPTFRGGTQQGKKQVEAETPKLDFAELISILEDKTGEQWNILLRLHPQLSAQMETMPLLKEDRRLIDVSQYPDISEILGGCDMLITDYSSCAFDAAFAGIPVLIYADDIQDYIEKRGQFMWKRDELPFDVAETNEELQENLTRFDLEQYLQRVRDFMTKYEVVEDGHASEKVADVIEEVM